MRALFRYVVTIEGDCSDLLAVEQAAVSIYRAGTTDAPVMWSAVTGGVVVTNPRISDERGLVKVWLDEAEDCLVDVVVSSNNGQATTGDEDCPADFATFTEEDLVAVSCGGGGLPGPPGPAGADGLQGPPGDPVTCGDCALDDLSDVDASAPDPGDGLVWDGDNWVPSPGAGGPFNCGDLGACSIENLGDVAAMSPGSGDVLTWTGVLWSSAPLPAPPDPFACSDLAACSVNDLGDVNTAGADSGEVLTFTGVGWSPVALPPIPAAFACSMLGGCAVEDLGNVAGGADTGDILAFDGTGWVPLPFPDIPGCAEVVACITEQSMGVAVHREAPLSVSGIGVGIAIEWDTQDEDSGPIPPGLWDPALPSRITAQADGWWHFDASLEITASTIVDAVVSNEFYLRRNGVTTDRWWADTKLAQADALGLLEQSMSISGRILLAEGDYVELVLHPFLGLGAETTNINGNCRLVASFSPV